MTLRLAVSVVIVFVLGTGFLSALYMVFVVHHVKGHAGPMLGAAPTVPLDFFVRRRVYAIEAWITFGFLAIFLALTWLAPEPRSARSDTAHGAPSEAAQPSRP